MSVFGVGGSENYRTLAEVSCDKDGLHVDGFLFVKKIKWSPGEKEATFIDIQCRFSPLSLDFTLFRPSSEWVKKFKMKR